jgi:hypothetical protein
MTQNVIYIRQMNIIRILLDSDSLLNIKTCYKADPDVYYIGS